jgi:hypothetical protein
VESGAPDEGRVHDKRYTAEYWYTTYQCYSYDKNGACTVNMPVQHHQGPTYCIDLYTSKDDHEWKCMDENTYLSYEVGDWYPRKHS